MNITNKLPCLIILMICTLSLSISAVQIQTKKTNKNINAREINTKKTDICAEISKAIRNIRAINELEAILKKYGLNKVRACEQQLKSDTSLKQSLKSLQIKNQSLQQRKFRSNKTTTLRKNIKANQRIEKLKLIGARKIQAQRNKPLSSSQNNQNGSPKISNITPATMAPGVNVVIEGSGFGNNQGNVTLNVSGNSFQADINAWQDNWINVYLPETISRVHQTNNAVIVVKMNNHKTLNFSIPFLPITEQKIVTGWFMEFSPLSIFKFSGHSGATIVFKNILLKNQWLAKEFVFSEHNSGKCKKATPFVSNGVSQLDSKIKWSHKWLEPLSCGIDVIIEGDKGFDAEVDEHIRSPF